MSSSWRFLAEFEPTQLREAADRVAQVHSNSADHAALCDTTAVAVLRERLIATPLEEVPSLAGRLGRSQLTAVADLLGGPIDDDLLAKAVHLGLIARLDTLRRRCWRLSVDWGPTLGLHQLLQGFAAEGTLTRALNAGDKEGERVLSWIAAATIQEGMLADRCANPVGDCDQWRSELPKVQAEIGSESGLWRAFREVFLRRAPAELLAAEATTSLLRMASDSSSATQEEFARHYLVALRPLRGWQEEVFHWISSRFGRLDYQNPVDFWRRTETSNPGILRDIAAWRAMKTLEEFFKSVSDPHHRFAFWKSRYGNQIIAAEMVAQGQAAYLHLPPLVVVEFAHVGNAAYVYGEEDLRWIESRRSSIVSSYKNESRLARIIHATGWEHAAAAMLDRLIQRGRTR